MGRVDLPYIQSVKDRHGKWHYYYRRGSFRCTLDRDNLAADYARVHAQFNEQPDRPATGTFGALVSLFYASSNFKQLRPATKENYRALLDRANGKWRDIKLTGITRKVLLTYRDMLAATPVTANYMLRTLSLLMNFAVERELLKENPIRGLKPLKVQSDGWKPWTDAQVETFAKTSSGAARVAFMLALHTGQRRGDVLKMRWDQIKGDEITITQSKTGKLLTIPIHQNLQEELTAWKASRKVTGVTIVHRENGLPYTDDGFGTIWTRAQNSTGVKAPFHGLRKNAAIRLVEAGCTPQEAQAITGHETLGMLNHYAKGVNQKRLARSAMKKVESQK